MSKRRHVHDVQEATRAYTWRRQEHVSEATWACQRGDKGMSERRQGPVNVSGMNAGYCPIYFCQILSKYDYILIDVL